MATNFNVWILFCTKIEWEIIGSQKYDVQKRSSYSSSHTDFTSSPFIFSLWHMFEPFLPSQSEKNLKWRGKSKWIIHNCSKPTHSPFNFFTQKSFFVLLHNSKVSTLYYLLEGPSDNIWILIIKFHAIF